MTEKRTLFVAQVLITCMMALLMSGIMSLIALGPSELWLKNWPKQFIIAWPIAFVLTMFVSRFAFFLASRLTGGFRR